MKKSKFKVREKPEDYLKRIEGFGDLYITDVEIVYYIPTNKIGKRLVREAVDDIKKAMYAAAGYDILYVEMYESRSGIPVMIILDAVRELLEVQSKDNKAIACLAERILES